MYRIQKTMEISASHKLMLDYESPCTRLHGHNYFVTIYARCEELDHNGMVMDFARIKTLVHDVFDHDNLNDIMPYNPTAENMAKQIADILNVHDHSDKSRQFRVYRVDVEETKNNIATWEEE